MIVRCSGELFEEPIEHTACLACSIENRHRPPCGFSYPVLKAIFASQGESRPDVHVSDVLGCLRKAYWEKKEPEAKYVHEMLILWIGISVHKSLEEAMQGEEGWRTEVPVANQGIVGRIDAITPNGDIIDFKTIRWMRPKNLPYGYHREQVQIYQNIEGLDGELFIQYVDVSGPTRCRNCHVAMRLIDGEVTCPSCGYISNDGHLGGLVKRVLQKDRSDETGLRTILLEQALDQNTIPDAEPGWGCRYCQFINRCPEGQEA